MLMSRYSPPETMSSREYSLRCWAAEFERRTGVSVNQAPLRYAEWLRAVYPDVMQRDGYPIVDSRR